MAKICGKTFRSIFQVGDTSKRVQNIANCVKTNNNTRPERRGGSRLDLQTLENRQELKKKIKEHIMKFRCKSNHYSRKQTQRALTSQFIGIYEICYALFFTMNHKLS
jgi:hypothetical protein